VISRKGFTIGLMSLSLAAVLALPALAQNATPEATPEPTVAVTQETTPEVTPAATQESTPEVTLAPTQVTTQAPTQAATQAATTEATQNALPPVPANAIASGLSNPRNIAYDTDGSLYIAEAGAGGAVVVAHTDQGDATAGFSSQVSVVGADGSQSVWLPGLTSFSSPTGETLGLEAAYPQGDSVWLVFGGAAPGTPPPFYMDAVEEVDKASGRVKTYIDVYNYEKTNNPDGAEIDSDAAALAWGADGTLYIIDAAGNDILSWTASGGLKTFAAWKDDPVPTGMAFASDGSFYVSFLGTGIAPGAGKIEHWSADGKTLIETFSNLTAVTTVAVGKDGGVYAVELAQFGAQGPMPNSGSVVEVSKDGATTVEDGLNAPYGLAQAPDGSWAVTVNSTFAPPGSGAVVKVGGS